MAFRAKRQSPRILQREGVRILTPRGLEYATVEDLSLGGLRLYLDHPMQLRLMIQLEFSIPDIKNTARRQALKVTGRVVRSEPSKDAKGFDIGIAFTDFSESTRSLLESLIDEGTGPF